MCILMLAWTYETKQAGAGKCSGSIMDRLHFKVNPRIYNWNILLPIFSTQEVQWIEYFAGRGNLSLMMRASEYTSLRFDLLDNDRPSHRSSNFMDLTHQSGFGFLGYGFMVVKVIHEFCSLTHIDLWSFTLIRMVYLSYFASPLTCSACCQNSPRLAVLALLRCIPNDFACHFGIKCSSLCKMNKGTSKRSACSSVGYTEYVSVQLGNTLLERTGNWHIIINHWMET